MLIVFTNCGALHLATVDERDHVLAPNLQPYDAMDVKDWRGVIPISSIRSSHQIVRSNDCVYPFTSLLPWPQRLF